MTPDGKALPRSVEFPRPRRNCTANQPHAVRALHPPRSVARSIASGFRCSWSWIQNVVALAADQPDGLPVSARVVAHDRRPQSSLAVAAQQPDPRGPFRCAIHVRHPRPDPGASSLTARVRAVAQQLWYPIVGRRNEPFRTARSGARAGVMRRRSWPAVDLLIVSD